MLRFGILLSAALLLSACGTSERSKPATQAPVSSDSSRDKYLQKQGNFKVGKPYSVFGRTYVPQETYEYVETGIASWYGPGFHGSKTASGETYNNDEMTAAHRTLQMPSLVKVTNLSNGRSVIVRVNDRGPFSKSRVMDVSKRAAERLGMIGPGTAKVKLELMPAESRAIAAAARNGVRTNGVEIAMNETGRLPDSYRNYMGEAVTPSQAYEIAAAAPLPVERIPNTPYAVVETTEGTVPGHLSEGKFYPEPIVMQEPVASTNIFVQAGAFGQEENAKRLAQRLGSIAPARVMPIQYNGRSLYKVQLGPLDSVASADKVLNQVLASGQSDAIITVK